jgi:hypothetical protein
MISRGLCLVLMAGHVRRLWLGGDLLSRMRAASLVAGLAGDWSFVAATLFDVSAVVFGRISRRIEVVGSMAVLCGGLYFLSKHDTESGQWILLGALGGVGVVRIMVWRASLPVGNIRAEDVGQGRPPHPLPLPIHEYGGNSVSIVPSFNSDRGKRNRAATIFAITFAWLIPIAAMILPNISDGPLARRLAVHCRFGEWADGDVERLAVWCRRNTPSDARFIGPPGPKTFRLWSRRELAFNRASSPYHAAGLADWSERFRDHVGFDGSIDDFAAAYLKDRGKLEQGYDRLDAERLASLATKEGASYVLAASKMAVGDSLERLKTEGRFAIYRVLPTSQGSVRIVLSRPRM